MQGWDVGWLRTDDWLTTSFQFFADAIQHAVNELYRLRAGKLACDFQGFVDDHRSGSCGKAHQLRYCRAHEIAVDSGHAFHAPVLGMSFDQAIDFRRPVGGNAEQIFGKALDIGAHVSPLTPEGLTHLL